MIVIRRADDRGYADHGWLQARQLSTPRVRAFGTTNRASSATTGRSTGGLSRPSEKVGRSGFRFQGRPDGSTAMTESGWVRGVLQGDVGVAGVHSASRSVSITTIEVGLCAETARKGETDSNGKRRLF